jgi:DNA polymerase-3 subunit delta
MLVTALDRVRAAERAVMAPANAGGILADESVLNLTRALARRG